jgi:hypothetical protein
MRRKLRLTPYLCALATLAISCTVSTPTAAPSSTPPPTQTPSPAPTLTPSPVPATSTAEEIATPTSPASVAGALSCRVLSQSVKNGTHFNPKDRFDMAWMVRNTGAAVWDAASTDFMYYSGERMFQSDRTQLQESVAPGDTVLLVADLLAPKSTGNHFTVWTLRQGDVDFCHVTLSITVP